MSSDLSMREIIRLPSPRTKAFSTDSASRSLKFSSACDGRTSLSTTASIECFLFLLSLGLSSTSTVRPLTLIRT